MKMRCINVFLICSTVLHLCNGMIMTKFGRVPFYYKLNAPKAKTGSAYFDKYNSQHLREQLCDSVINAKQFQGRYHEKHYAKMKTDPQVGLRMWDYSSGHSLNYQKFGSNAPEPQQLLVRMHDEYKWLFTIECVNTNNIHWFITLLPGQDYLYLLEPSLMEKSAQKGLLITGLFEPSATVDYPDFGYFFRQFSSKRDEMTSICNLGMDGRLRVCAAVLDALNTKGVHELDQQNYLRHDHRCVQRFIRSDDKFLATTSALPCTHADEFRPTKARIRRTSLVYLLADANKRGAAFVLLGDKIGGTFLYGRVTNMRALMQPIPKRANSNPNRNNARIGATRVRPKAARSKQKTNQRRGRSTRKSTQSYYSDLTTTINAEPKYSSETTTDEEIEYQEETTDEERESRLSRNGRNYAKSCYVKRPAPEVQKRRVNPQRAGRPKNLAHYDSDTEIPRRKSPQPTESTTTDDDTINRRPIRNGGNPKRRRLILYDDDDDPYM